MATISTTPEGFELFLSKLSGLATVEAPRLEQTALLTGLAKYKRRIFNSGRDTLERKIGKKARRRRRDKFVGDYTKNYYDSVRAKRGAGIDKNLNIDGGALRNQIQVGRSGDINTFGFVNDRAAVIGVGQEDIHKKAIFTPSAGEVDAIIDEYLDGIRDFVSESLKSIAIV